MIVHTSATLSSGARGFLRVCWQAVELRCYHFLQIFLSLSFFLMCTYAQNMSRACSEEKNLPSKPNQIKYFLKERRGKPDTSCKI